MSAELIPLLSQPTRVSGPGITWVHDTRNNPLDATSGWYLSAQQFFAWEGFASQANFNRVDVQESNYYRLNRENWILARSTRIGHSPLWLCRATLASIGAPIWASK